MNKMMIKVCGMRDAENIRAVEDLDIDLIGFVFYPESPRYVQMIPSKAGIIPDYSEERLKQNQEGDGTQEIVPMPRTKRVGVFVDDMPQNIVTRIYNYNLDYVQLHGEETPVMIDNLIRTVDPDIHPGIKIIKTISVKEAGDIEKWRPYKGHADLLLFDTSCREHGGCGNQFDWSLLQNYDGDIPFILSGGIGPDDAEKIKAFCHPMFVGVDLNSRFEIEPGLKNVELIKAFVQELRQ